MVSQKEIAKMMGVNTSTISRALAGHPHVDENLRYKIIKTCSELGYHPNYSAQSLSGKGTRLISVVRPGHYTVSELHTRWLCALARKADEYGFRTRSDAPAYAERVMAERSADGLIVIGNLEEHFPELIKYKASGMFPIVNTDCPALPSSRDSIAFDSEGGIIQAIDHLVGLGHGSIAFFGHVPFSPLSRERLMGYLKGITAHGLPSSAVMQIGNRQWLTEVNDVWEYKEELMAAIKSGATAVITVSDMAAVGVMKILSREGIAVPEDVSVIGFDNSSLSRAWTPELTSISQNIEGASEQAMDRLLTLIRTRESQPGVVIPTTLILRETTAPPRK